MTEPEEGSKAPENALDPHALVERPVAGDIRSFGDLSLLLAAAKMSSMPMCVSDPHQHDNPLIFVNRAFEDMTGYRREEILGRNCRFLQGPESNPSVVAEIGRSIRAKADISVDLYNYRKDGSGFWNALYLSPVLDEAGSLLYFFSSQLDVTRQHQAEAMALQNQGLQATLPVMPVTRGFSLPASGAGSEIVLQHVLLDIQGGDEDGRLVFGKDGLTAVLVCLSGQHGRLAGRWHLERGFGVLDGLQPPPFIDLDAARRWIGEQLDLARAPQHVSTSSVVWLHKQHDI